jgi:hypothetical protein
MNVYDVTALFATEFLGLKPTRDRFMKPDGSWMPKWRFAPFTCLEDAFLLLEQSASEFKLSKVEGGTFSVEVRIGGRAGNASGQNKARTISLAIVNAIGLEAPES